MDVNGSPATFVRQGGELIVTSRQPLSPVQFVVTVRYSGTMGQPTDNTRELYGWVAFKDGAFVGNEPEGASTWYPVDDVPYDKDLHVHDHPSAGHGRGRQRHAAVPADAGREDGVPLGGAGAASYLSMAASGSYTLTTATGSHGLPIVNAVDKDLDAAKVAAVLSMQPEMISFFETSFGRYPFGSFGAVVDDDKVGYALENQTRPI